MIFADPMTSTAGLAALALAALFAGAAFYVSAVEHPARMTLPPEQALAQWAPAYARGYAMQATLAALGGIAGIASWLLGGGALFLAGGAALLVNWPWTLIAIKPVNDRLKHLLHAGDVNDSATPLLSRWAKLHAVRTALGIAATLLYIGAMA